MPSASSSPPRARGADPNRLPARFDDGEQLGPNQESQTEIDGGEMSERGTGRSPDVTTRAPASRPCSGMSRRTSSA